MAARRGDGEGRPQRHQKQKAQQRLGVYGSFFARGQASQEESDDGDYRERLTAAQQRKRKAEEEQREKEIKEKEDQQRKEQAEREEEQKQQKTETHARKRLKVSSDGSSQELDVVGSSIGSDDGDKRWANEFLLQSSQDDSPSPPTMSLSPGSPAFSFNIVLPEWEEGTPPPARVLAFRRRTNSKTRSKPKTNVHFNEVVEVLGGRRGKPISVALAPAEEEGMQFVVSDNDSSPLPPPIKRNPHAEKEARERAKRLRKELYEEEEEEEGKEEDNTSEEEQKKTKCKKTKAKRKGVTKRETNRKGRRRGTAEKENDNELAKAAEPEKPEPRHTKSVALFHRECLNHLVPPDHCEVPERLSAAIGCLEELYETEENRIDLMETPSKADLRWVKAVHDAGYVRKMSEKVPTQDGSQLIMHATQTTQEMLNPDIGFWTDTYMSPSSWAAALYAAGSVIDAVDLVIQRTYRNAVCAVRPPGHHCGRKGRTGDVKSQGFCILNNVAIGAKYALLKHDLERIAIVDFDVHAGNGTEEIFEGDDNFLFISIHAVGENFYPETGHTSNGNIFNVPLPHCTTPETYRKEFEKIIQKLDDFRPQFLFLSSGFDGHKCDPIRGPRKKEGFSLTGLDYHYITTQLLGVAERHCQGRVVSVLEGGYDVGSRTRGLAESFKAHVLAMIGCGEDAVSVAPSPVKEVTRRRMAKRTKESKPDRSNGKTAAEETSTSTSTTSSAQQKTLKESEVSSPKSNKSMRMSLARGRPKPPGQSSPTKADKNGDSDKKRKRPTEESEKDENTWPIAPRISSPVIRRARRRAAPNAVSRLKPLALNGDDHSDSQASESAGEVSAASAPAQGSKASDSVESEISSFSFNASPPEPMDEEKAEVKASSSGSEVHDPLFLDYCPPTPANSLEEPGAEPRTNETTLLDVSGAPALKDAVTLLDEDDEETQLGP